MKFLEEPGEEHGLRCARKLAPVTGLEVNTSEVAPLLTPDPRTNKGHGLTR